MSGRRRLLAVGALFVTAAVGLFVAPPADAHHFGRFGFGFGFGYPVFYAPPVYPVYVAPPPVAYGYYGYGYRRVVHHRYHRVVHHHVCGCG